MPPLPSRCTAAALSGLLLAGAAHGQTVEAPCVPEAESSPLTALPQSLGEAITWSSDHLQAEANGNTTLSGDVRVRMGGREMRADQLHYDAANNSVQADGHVSYTDPSIHVAGDSGRYGNEAAEFTHARFEMLQQPGRGTADSIALTPAGAVQLRNVTYTTCPQGVADWLIRAGNITLDSATRRGSGANARLEFKGVPILYVPYISFPLSDARQTGLLFPTFGSSTRSGAILTIPWYWNIAPQQDLTLEPTIYTRRGIDIGAEYRLLTANMRGALKLNYLPHDRLAGSERSFIHLTDRWQLPRGWRLDIDARNVSDVHYFEDFATGSQASSMIFLPRRATLGYRNEVWRLRADLRQFQTLDLGLAASDRPYAELPRIAASGYWRRLRGFEAGFDSEFTGFTRADGIRGWRAALQPTLDYTLSRPGWYFKPAAAWDLTAYTLSDVPGDEDTSPTRSLPILSIDAGLRFERDAGSRATRRITLEPRLYYLYVPYRDQSAIPVFDTALPDPNVTSLFAPNRYVGGDRLSDANEITVGLTTQAFSNRSGQRFLSATLGQSLYLKAPRVRLPGELPDTRHRSSLIADVDLRAYKDLSLRYVVAWDPTLAQTSKSSVALQYRPSTQQVLNLGYRFLGGQMEQVDGSVAWPLGKRWDIYARSVYSLMDRKSIENFAGFRYRGNCWGLRFVVRRSVSSRTGIIDSGFYLQLELNGLSSVGTGADAFLEQSIRGYSASGSSR